MVGSQTIAENTISNGVTTLNWILSDQVNSTTVTANADGTWNSAIIYSAFGEIRSASGNTPTQYRFTSQLAQPELGLDWYASRFYDPYLNHWIQPDPIIPNINEPQSWDRYTYVDDNPISHNDPAGNKPCYFEDNNGCGWTPPPTLAASKSSLSEFGITIKNDGASWNKYYANDLLITAMQINYVLGNIYGKAEAFRDTIGKTTIYAEPPTVDKKGNQGYYGWTDGDAIMFYGHLSPEDMIHEFGHRLNNATNQGLTNLLNDPTHAVYDVNGNFVTGNTGNGYNRGGNRRAPENGYQSDALCPYQCHPRSMPGGNSANEEWADMFMNFIGNTFAPNPAGDALFSWTTMNLTGFIK